MILRGFMKHLIDQNWFAVEISMFLMLMAPAVVSDAQEKPNILLIVADDMGMSDLGSFGGEFPTPNLDALAYDGIRLTNFHVAPTCSPTRAMLLTGLDAHKVGLGNMAEEMAPNQAAQPGHEGYLNNRAQSIASLLKNDGYRTYMTGKWHLGNTSQRSPAANGFDKSFVLSPGAASHFADMKPADAPSPDSKAHYMEDGKKIEQLPENFNYSSQFYVDQMIEYLDSDEETPFFAYLSYTAPHWPLQAPANSIDLFKGAYVDGYDALFEKRLNKQKQLGIIAEDAEGTQRFPGAEPWSSLSHEERLASARSMEIYAAMMHEMDLHTGRLLDYLKKTDRFDNTLIIFMSDNGAEGHTYDETWPADAFPQIRAAIDASHDFSYENMGKPNSYVLYGPNWARASTPAYKYSKGFPSEGGIRVASFIHYPKSLPHGEINHDFFTVKDIVPTILDATNIVLADNSVGKESILPLEGISMLPSLKGEVTMNPDRVDAGELMGKYFVRRGNWKMINMPAPYGTSEWQLYNLSVDPGENNDLANVNTGIKAELMKFWQSYVKENAVIFPDFVSGY